jgi:ParB-like chromosome segregation protein Spo0J
MTRKKQMSIEMVPLSAIEANPYRHIEKYELSEEKLQGLINSYANSGFWDGSIQARPHPKKQGKYQIAFGHHRIEAARRAEIERVGLVIANRTNGDMLRMMADENREEFRSDARVTIETLAAVIEAYDRGEIELDPIDPKTNESYVYALPSGRAYTLPTVARFLGWVKSDGRNGEEPTSACRAAFDAYLVRESTEKALDSIPAVQRSEIAVKTITAAVNVARKAAEDAHLSPTQIRQAQKQAAMDAAQEVRENTGSKAREEAKRIGHQAAAKVAGPKVKGGPDVEEYIKKLINKCNLDVDHHDIVDECRRLIPFLDDLDPDQLSRLADSIENYADRQYRTLTDLAKTFRSSRGSNLKGKLLRLLPAEGAS